MYKVLAILGLLLACHLAHADGVAVCGDASKSGQGLMSCVNSLSYQSGPAADALILTCQSSSVQPGNQDMSKCPVSVWKKRADIVATELVGYCAQSQLDPHEACDYPSGAEGWRYAQDIWGSSPASAGSLTLRWNSVYLNDDGGGATVTGYRIEYGQNDFSHSVTGPGSKFDYTMLLSPGTWQFRIVTLSNYGNSLPTKPLSYAVAGDPSSPPVPTVALSANPTSITAGQSSTLSWTSVNATSCSGVGTSTAGSTSVTPQSTTTYTQTCSGAGGSASASTVVTVNSPQPQTWVVASNGSGSTVSIYEAVLPLSGSALVRGNVDGTIAAGKPCGAEVFVQGGVSYRSITNSDAQLKSPTYAQRSHVAVCTQL